MKAHALLVSLAALALGAAAIAQRASAPAPPAEAKPRAAASGGEMPRVAAWYGHKFAGRKTASGQRFDPNAMTAAHRTLAFGTRAKITNEKSMRSVVVVIDDRGPTSTDRIVDVSLAAAQRLGFVRSGLTNVTLEVVSEPKRRSGKQ